LFTHYHFQEKIMSKHPFVHVEISARDRKVAADFYSSVFGWEVQHMDEMHYSTFTSGEGEVGGGFNPVTDQNPAGTVTVYIGTDDIEASLAVIEAHGGKTILSKTEIPQMGWFAFFQDPSGNTMALYKGIGE
jgi:predicted enzyme related to lactoylglutathione lyase